MPATPPTIPAIPEASVVASGSSTRTAAIASTPTGRCRPHGPAGGPHVPHRPRGEHAQRGAVRTADDVSSSSAAATYAPPTPHTRKTSSGAHQPWRFSSNQPNSAIAPSATASYPAAV